MATTSIRAIHSNLESSIRYILNPDKVAITDTAFDEIVPDSDRSSPETLELVDGINCVPESAYQEMMAVKNHYRKTGDVIAYVGYQSFAPGELTALTAHKIGLDLANQLWGDRFQILVATHSDQRHIHNHFIFNSVSFINGKKLMACKYEHLRMSKLSDKLCREANLSVIENPGKAIPKGLHYMEEEGMLTFLNIIKMAIDRACSECCMIEEFRYYLKQLGYYYKYDKTYDEWRISSVDDQYSFRCSKLPSEYRQESIQQRLAENFERSFAKCEIPTPNYPALPLPSIESVPDTYPSIYELYAHLLDIDPAADTAPDPFRVPLFLRGDLLKADYIRKELNFLRKHHIESDPDLQHFSSSAEAEITALLKERNDLRNMMRRQNPELSVSEISARREEISERLQELRAGIKLAKTIPERSSSISQKLDNYLLYRQKEIEQSRLARER